MTKLKKVNDSYTQIYENEVLKFKGDEFRVLSFLRIKAGGENGLTWYSKEKLQEILTIGRDKLDKIISTLEEAGAVIIFNIRDKKSKKSSSNIYYITEYDAKSKTYMTANNLEEIKQCALEERETKERDYAKKNNLTPRNFELVLRPTKEERKVKFYIPKNENEKPSTENQYPEPPTENQYPEPPTENQYPIYNKIPLNKKNLLKEEEGNNALEEFRNNYFNAIGRTLTKKQEDTLIEYLETFDKKVILKAIELFGLNTEYKRFTYIISTLSDWERNNLFTIDSVNRYIEKHIETNIKATENKKNRVEKLAKPIPKTIEKKPLRFANYEQRDYDYDSLEWKLLGWGDKNKDKDNSEVI